MDQQKIIFIDVDGTLIYFDGEKGIIPESAIDAIKKAQKQGNLVYLCTGRGMAEITDELASMDFDGIIGASGGFILEGKEYSYHKTLSRQQVEHIIDFFEKNHVGFYLESNSGLYYNQRLKEMYTGTISEQFLSMMIPLEKANLEDINKVSYTSDTLAYEDFENEFANEFNLVKSSFMDEDSNSGEVSIKGVSKGSAIQFLLEKYHIQKENAYAFGDSMNDIEMLKAVGHPCVMGNYMHGVDKYAEFITDKINRDGLYKGFEHFHLF